MTVRTRLKRTLKLCTFTLVGMWLGAHAGTPLDDIFTGESTIAFVGIVFGGWAGSMFGGGGWADTVKSFRQQSGSAILPSMLVAFGVIVGVVAIVRFADSSTRFAGTFLGIAMMAYLLARGTRYRYVFAAIVFGTFVGAAISAAGGNAAVEHVLHVLQESGLQDAMRKGQSGNLRHYYLGRDREYGLLAGVAVGYLFVGAVTMITFFGLGLLRISIRAFDKRTSRKRKPQKIN